MDCTENRPEENEYIRWALYNEGNTAFLDYLDQEGISLERNPIEFTVYEPGLHGGQSGIDIDLRCSSSIGGLFGAGDAIGGVKRAVSPGALVTGWIAGENAAKTARERSGIKIADDSAEIINNRIALAQSFQSRSQGSPWWEAQLALQNIMGYYAGRTKSESMLRAGLQHIDSLRERTKENMQATNPHEMFRAMEILNLIDVAELVITASLARKESRGEEFFRVDYPQTDNDNWLKFITLTKNNGKIAVEHRLPK